ncbi:hypothetical protein C4D60_Mb06t36380 [Musa balbisiana]|uniref:EF-hand domain-containing protein n=1 Tax=Musa balbisiana TaxID=52838 RepID=A0A4S8IVQ3_MUSBA|nr:hypothetical protein C4D60_Mb06t36380 [Musa balbisiana]
MAKPSAATVLIYATVALLTLLLLASVPPRTPRRHRQHHHRRLKLSHNTSSHHQIPFDPIIADIERRREARKLEGDHFRLPHHEESQPEWDDFFDAKDYVDGEDRFNITHRIVVLFPRIDVAPADGFVSSTELAEWNFQQAAQQEIHRSGRELELCDSNGDGFVSFEEYRQSGRFLHPADSGNPKLIQWLCKEEIRQKDGDEDGKLNFDEYFVGLFDSILDDDGPYNHSATLGQAKMLFSKLDQDNDGFLSGDELVGVIGKIHHSECYHAKQQADYALSEADSDRDSQLSLMEMIEHPYVFYSSIFSDDEDEDFDDFDYHDEFR